ncbi:MAG: STAS domain-containing protein [Desulfovibrionaceae bacterium]|nr:STAS domain-containing protein [Desulfovibrionaceae bacterium]MBF0515279.1 STAS domain-containing protein [Desulfovibrionaceae bacterium]
MGIGSREIDGITIVEPEGRLDAASAKSFKDAIMRRAEKGGQRLVVDLSRVRFLDSSGLGVLVSCLRRFTDSGGDIKLCGLRPEIQSLFALTRLNKVFDIFVTAEEAAAAF